MDYIWRMEWCNHCMEVVQPTEHILINGICVCNINNKGEDDEQEQQERE